MQKPNQQYSSIQSLAGDLSVSPQVIRQAKKAGAAGFLAAGRIDPKQLLRWCLTRGKAFEPKMSLEGARAMLAESRAKAIQVHLEKTGGLHVELGHALAAFDAALDGLGAFADSIQSEAWLLSLIANSEKRGYAEAEVRFQLAQMAASYWSNVEGARSAFEASLTNDGDGENLLARYQRILKGLGEAFSDALQKIHDDLPPEHRGTLLKVWGEMANPTSEAESRLRELHEKSWNALQSDLKAQSEAAKPDSATAESTTQTA